ncbi:MAG TPA: c-type cytochrome [Pyrinomonadaceae bacterium]
MIQSVRWWVTSGLFLVLIAFLLIELTVIAAPFGQRRVATSRRRTNVAELFRNNCARCHGADGRGDTPLGHTYNAPDFTDASWWRKHSDITSTRSLVGIVSRGKSGMPAFGKKLKRSEITALVNYVKRFRPQK